MRCEDVRLVAVTVDRLALLQRIESSEAYSELLNSLWNLHAVGQARTWRTKYQTRARITLPGAASVFVELGYAARQRYLKLDFKPPALSTEAWMALDDLLSAEFRLPYRELRQSARITYFELAADFSGIDSGDLFPFHRRLRIGDKTPRSETDYPTHYLGHRRHSPYTFCIYARAQKLDRETSESLTRIELRARRVGITVDGLVRTPGILLAPYSGLVLCNRPSARRLIRMRPWLGTHVLEEELRSGAQRALFRIGDARLRARTMDLLAPARCSWWDVDAIRARLPEAVAILDRS